ncbi:SLC13 family permease [Oleidesulfovibrio sp.]|uniref:SLC13 family permease n=1 Tax=Oleidesulfovibrio sp. TaxID=2909707 RepID=UPI003A8AEB8B
MSVSKITLRNWLIAFAVAGGGAFFLQNPENPKLGLYWFETIFAIAAFALELMPMFATAVLLMIAYIVTGIASPDLAFVGWSTPIPWVIMCGMLVGALMERTKLSNRIALRAIACIGTTPIRLYISMIVAGYAIGAIIPDVVTVTILFMTIAAGMCSSMKLKKGSVAATTLIMAAFFGATVPATNYLPNNVGIVGLLMVKEMGVPIEWLPFFIENLAFSLLVAVACIGILHVFGSRELGKYMEQCLAHASEELNKIGKMSADEIKTLILTGLALAAFATESLHGIPGYYAFCGVVLLGFTPAFNLLKKEDVEQVQFSILFFVVGCMAIGIVAGSLGIPALMAAKIVPYLESMNSLAATSMLAYFTGVLANFALTPVAAASSLSIPLAEIAVNLGLEIKPLLYSFFYGLDQFLFPYELAAALIMFATGYVRMRYLVMIMFARMICAGVAVWVVGATYWQWISF